MSAAAAWLDDRVADAPAALRSRMLSALRETPAAGALPDLLAGAALLCLRRALRDPAGRASALDLLAADALLTHACEAAAENGADALLAFTRTWDPTRFQELLDQA
ncbi:MAG TPA: hypothetical protein VF021_04945 [Longimicrobiales bacterium]